MRLIVLRLPHRWRRGQPMPTRGRLASKFVGSSANPPKPHLRKCDEIDARTHHAPMWPGSPTAPLPIGAMIPANFTLTVREIVLRTVRLPSTSGLGPWGGEFIPPNVPFVRISSRIG